MYEACFQKHMKPISNSMQSVFWKV